MNIIQNSSPEVIKRIKKANYFVAKNPQVGIMEEKLCVKWSDFHENINSSFASIRKDFEFADVTLACEDGQQLEAHRVILAASSPFFQRLFRRNQHTHPLLYMRDVAFQDLVAIVDFLYCGEANIFQTNLDSFLALAEDLKLEGIIGGKKDENFAKSTSLGEEFAKSTSLGGESPSTEIGSCLNSDQKEFDTYQSPSPVKKETSKEFWAETELTNEEEGEVGTGTKSSQSITNKINPNSSQTINPSQKFLNASPTESIIFRIYQ